MRTLRSPLLLTALLVACGGGTEPDGALTENRTLFVDGEPRTFVLHVPENSSPSALIVAFHGAGGNGIQMRGVTDLDELAEEMDAAIAYPNADEFNWAEDCGCTNADIVHSVGDTALVSGIIESVTSEFGISTASVYGIGFSQGGMFAQRVACQMTDRFKAVAVVAATMSVPLSETCAPSVPISLLMMLSEVDTFFPWNGHLDGSLSTIGAQEAAALWANRNGCTSGATESVNGGVRRTSYEGCSGGSQVELIGISSGSHAWQIASDVDTSFEIERFFALVDLSAR